MRQTKGGIAPARTHTTNNKLRIQYMKLTQNIFTKLGGAAQVSLALIALACIQFSARAENQVPFHTSYHLALQMTVEPPFGHITSEGTAQATHLGSVTARAIHETVNLLTGEGVATHAFTAANGDIILVEFRFLAIPTSPTLYSVTGFWEISDGTGRFEGASGSGSYEGQVDFTSPATANGSFTMQGTISSPGSLK